MADFRLVCAGCGAAAPPLSVEPYPFRCHCARSQPDVDHIVTKVHDDGPAAWPRGSEENPFIRYRALLYSYQVARASGMTDAEYVTSVRHLDEAVQTVAGQRFRRTPFARNDSLSAALGFSADGGAWVKDETGNVSGSHKGRHLMGLMLYLQVVRDRKVGPEEAQRSKELAIASCGNAALAAAVVACAAGRPLRTFVPPDASPAVLQRLTDLGARIEICRRQAGEAGDPCYLRFREAVEGGAVPFCCQGPDNGLTIEGGETLAYEMVDALPAVGRAESHLDAIAIQVGGGALASACVQGFERAVALGKLRKHPRVYAVQTRAAAPLARAFERARTRAKQTGVESAVRYAAAHRSEFMWPWETAPHSIAHGILDDETYDWLAVVRGMLQTGGGPIVVDEPLLAEANTLARETTGIDVDPTGSAGLAGLIALRDRGDLASDDRVAVIFSGVRRA